MSGPQRLSAEAFAAELLRDEPNLDYATIRERAKAAGISVQPIHYGRARKQLGLPALRDSRPEPRPAQGRPITSSGEAATTRFDDPAPAGSPAPEDEEEPPSPGKGDVEESAPAAMRTQATEDLVSPRRKGSPAFDYLLQQLRNEPNILYAALRDRCATQGFTIAPIMYGRAKAVLGLVPVKPRGKKAAAAKMPVPGVPMQLKQVESVAADRFAKKLDEVRNLEQLVAIVKDLDSERRRLRDVIERVVTLLDTALSPS